MSVNWTLYEKLLGLNGQNADVRDHAISGAVDSFLDGVVDDPAYQKNAKINGVETPIIASRSSAIKCSIKASPYTSIHIGDMVECLGEDWIVVELYVDKIGIINGEMWLCNHEIKFQNRSNYVNTRKCVVDDGTYSKKSSDPDAFIMANTYKIYLSMDNATERLYVDKRLSFGEVYSSDGSKILEVYKIIGIDMRSKNYGTGSHLMILSLQRDVYREESDSIQENICDLFKGDASEAIKTQTGSCSIDGRDVIRIGTSRKYVALYADAEGNSVTDAESDWDVTAPYGVDYSIDQNACTINVPLDSKLVGDTISIRVSDVAGTYGSFEKKVQVVTVG